ncbi:hypothetical protein EET67_01635 [Pseudaminobacter arsenicus]|uniref:Tat pathway signal sequence domain protein n=1 Tax=Borborobacter arsenicus TaxID=1851146 RepID=A0A432VBT1_9HYPH|nr:hypothetical protein [Pseudaminobacter arsenicus]RUM99618.1 hypothetical protein EET67_01635 [Pseudaminobacter arsenicus]
MPKATTLIHPLASMMVLSLVLGMPSYAQEAPSAPSLELELNATQPSDKGCRLTFVVANKLGSDLSKAAFEIALFNDAGVVDRLTVLDFKDLPKEKTKVIRFDLAGVDCARISRVLINQATECAGADVEPGACMGRLKLNSRTDTVFST